MSSSQKQTSSSPEGLAEVESNKCCSICKTTKTPLWRSGPSGPKSLCNACGIRHRKKRPTSSPGKNVDVKKKKKNKKKKKKGIFGKERNMEFRDAMKVNLMMPLGEGLPVRRHRQWDEVERAALLLMAMSCGAVFA